MFNSLLFGILGSLSLKEMTEPHATTETMNESGFTALAAGFRYPNGFFLSGGLLYWQIVYATPFTVKLIHFPVSTSYSICQYQ